MIATTPAAVLALGFALGLRHALDVDHLAAIATIVSERRSVAASSIVGAVWGLGHTAALLLVATAVLSFHATIPPGVTHALELGVAAMLIALGLAMLRRLWMGATLHLHTHAHGGRPHLHVHVHRPNHTPVGEPGAHHHPISASRRPFLVGLLHGLAGSGGLMLLVLATIPERVVGFAYVAAFGIGSIGGMMAMTTLLSVPLLAASTRFHWATRAIQTSAALASVAVGLAVAWRIGLTGGAFGSGW